MISSQQTKSYYEVLGIKKSASDQEIKKAYREKSLEYHPDKHPELDGKGSPELFSIQEAYDVLSDPAKKADVATLDRTVYFK